MDYEPRLLVFDTETTGLTVHPNAPLELQPRMIEFGGIYLSMNDGSILAEFEQLINPEMPIPAEATKVNGITDDMVKNAPTFAEYANQLQDIFAGCVCAIAHNLPFDKSILHYECARTGAKVKMPWCYCSIDIYRHSWGKDMKLADLYKGIIGRDLKQTHRGLDDVRALVEIIRADRLHHILL